LREKKTRHFAVTVPSAAFGTGRAGFMTPNFCFGTLWTTCKRSVRRWGKTRDQAAVSPGFAWLDDCILTGVRSMYETHAIDCRACLRLDEIDLNAAHRTYRKEDDGVAGHFAERCAPGDPWEDMHMKKFTAAAAMAAALMSSTAAMAADLEVTHWWTSGGESAAVAEFARLFNETGNKWVDSALAGSGTGANPVIISRILGGNPMGATQMNTGRDAEGLIQAGLIRSDLDSRGRGLERLLCRSRAVRCLHLRRQDLLRPRQYPFLALAVAEHQGL
jgi:hypothetical protein